ncbi:superfamily II DNA and RNA helicase, partial [Candidatus Scalindua japonica]
EFRLSCYHGFYRPCCQYGKGQDIKNCNLAQIEDAVNMNIKEEWNSDDDD